MADSHKDCYRELVEQGICPIDIGQSDKERFRDILTAVYQDIRPAGILEVDLCHTLAALLLQKHLFKIPPQEMVSGPAVLDRQLTEEEQDESALYLNRALMAAQGDDPVARRKLEEERERILARIRARPPRARKTAEPLHSKEALVEALEFHDILDRAIDKALGRIRKLQGTHHRGRIGQGAEIARKNPALGLRDFVLQ